MSNSLAEKLKQADPDLLKEVLRSAESRLDAQLTTALAADSRAMNFLGFTAALAVASIGASLAILASDEVLAAIGLIFGAGFVVAAWFAYEAAKPIDFEMIGNYPSEWVSDIVGSVSLHDASAELAAHYDEMLKNNSAAMVASGSKLTLSAKIAKISVLIGAVGALGFQVGRHLCWF